MKEWMKFTLKLVLIFGIIALTGIGMIMKLNTDDILSGDSALSTLALAIILGGKNEKTTK